MRKIFLILMTLFAVITFIGAGYVLYTGGRASAGFAVIPMLFEIVCSQAYFTLKNKKK